MINPSEIGKSGEMVRLKTLESIWIQGKLRMWGRWSYIGGGSKGNMFNQLLVSEKVTKTAIKEALRRMKKAGVSKAELAIFLQEILKGKNKSSLAFCTDEEGLMIDGVIGRTLIAQGHSGLYDVIVDRYRGRKSKRIMAEELNRKHPEWCYMTCRRRIDLWLSLSESILYASMCDVFGKNNDKLALHCEPISA